MTAPLVAPIQARMGTSGSGAVGIDKASARTVLPPFQVELREGSYRSIDARNLELWQYECFMKMEGTRFGGS